MAKLRKTITGENTYADDPNLSLRAKGLLGVLIGKPDEFDCSVECFTKFCSDGTQSVQSTIRELTSKKYMAFRRFQKGRYPSYTYDISDSPIIDVSD